MKRSAFLAVACAGCMTHLPVDEPTGKANVTGGRVRTIPWDVNGRVGMSMAGLFFKDDSDREFYEDGLYVDIRYRYEFAWHWGVEASVGQFHCESKPGLVTDPETGREVPFEPDDIDCIPIRLTVTFGGESRRLPVRWFAGGGGGYLIFGGEEGTLENPLDNEWSTHVLAGLEVRPSAHLEFPICTRIDVGYIWPGESKKEMILAGLTFYFSF